MNTLDPTIFNEANASQKRAVELLRSMSYVHVPRTEVDHGIEAWNQKRKALAQRLLSGKVKV